MKDLPSFEQFKKAFQPKETSMNHPLRIQRSRLRGSRKPPGSVYVGRPTRYGNPFEVSEHGREKAVELYRAWLVKQIEQGRIDLEPLKGKHLSCWCSLDVACHADVLCELANERSHGEPPTPAGLGSSAPSSDAVFNPPHFHSAHTDFVTPLFGANYET
jgi:hypothetical protein